MPYEFTPEEAQSTAEIVAKYYSKRRFDVKCETEIHHEAEFVTTLICWKRKFAYLIEVLAEPDLDNRIILFKNWLGARRIYCEFHIAVKEGQAIPSAMLQKLKKNNIGLILVNHDSENLDFMLKSNNPALCVTPDPTLNYGNKKHQVTSLIEKFNGGERHDALRDMCELAEGLTHNLLIKAIKKGRCNLVLSNVENNKIDWSGKINALASKNQHTGRPTITEAFKVDLHSFRNARNLLDHPVPTVAEKEKREKQFAERMMGGPRIVSEIIKLKNSIK